MLLKKLILSLVLLTLWLGSLPAAAAGIQVYSNNAVTTLSADASSATTTLSVSSSSLFPTLSGGNWFIATLEHLVSGIVTVNEIVKVTVVSGTTWTVVRAQEGTGAVSWVSGDTVALLPTAGGLAQFTQPGAVNGDCTVNSSFQIVCTKTNGVPFGNSSTTRVSYAAINGTTSGCSIISSSLAQSSNISSCGGVTGQYFINFTTAYTTNPPVCTASAFNQNLVFVNANPQNTSQAQFNCSNASGTPINCVLLVTCSGT